MNASRSRLLSLLTEACELEHGLACSYLYAAFSLKQEAAEGLKWEQLQAVRLWASELYAVAAEEMLHLAQVWNILAAVGGTPYYLRPNFPQRRTYYGFGLPLKLERFGEQALERFILYETPADLIGKSQVDSDDDTPGVYRSVGELYALIRAQILAIPEQDLFFATGAGSMDTTATHFPDIVPVRDRGSALAAIALITEQGEGTDRDRGDSHFAVFQRTLSALKHERAKDPQFEPARSAIDNPAPRLRGDWNSPDAVNELLDPYSRDVADLFDDVYSLMLRLLQHAFATGPEGRLTSAFCDSAINLMTIVIKPLGEALTRLPSGNGDNRAGAAFGLTRHATLPASEAVALTLVRERMGELAHRAATLAAQPNAPSSILLVAANLERIGATLREREP